MFLYSLGHPQNPSDAEMARRAEASKRRAEKEAQRLTEEERYYTILKTLEPKKVICSMWNPLFEKEIYYMQSTCGHYFSTYISCGELKCPQDMFIKNTLNEMWKLIHYYQNRDDVKPTFFSDVESARFIQSTPLDIGWTNILAR